MVATMEPPHEKLQGETFTPILCGKCGDVLAIDIGSVLMVGAIRFRLSVTFYCQSCGEPKRWHPARKRHD